MPPRNVWTADLIEMLREMWTRGLSAGQCANLIPGGFSRSAIIGKVHRLKLGGHSPVKPPKPRRPKMLPQKRKPNRPAMLKAPPELAADLWSVAAVMRAEPEPADVGIGRKRIVDLEATDCRWPIGDGDDLHFCGRPNDGMSSYCDHHHRIAYVKTAPMRDKYVKRRVA